MPFAVPSSRVGCVLLAFAVFTGSAMADQIRFDRPSEWRQWSLPLGAVELDGDVIRTVELRRGTDAISNLADFDGGIRAAGSNTATARRTIDGSEATGWEPDWDRPAEDWYIEIDLGRAVNASSVSLVFDDEAPAFELFDLLLSTGEPETDFIAAPIPGSLIYRIKERFKGNRQHIVTLPLEEPDSQPIQFIRVDFLLPTRGARLMEVVASAVAQAAMDSGVAQKPIEDMDAYRRSLRARLNPTISVLTQVYENAREEPKRVIFAEAEEEVVLRAAIQFRDGGYGVPVLVGRDKAVVDMLHKMGVDNPGSFEIHNSVSSPHVGAMVEMLYERLQRRGYLRRDVQRMVNRDRNIFGSALLKLGQADAMITGTTRTYSQSLREVRRVLDPTPGAHPFGIHVMVGKSHTVFIADTTVNERPTPEMLAHIAEQTAKVAKRMGQEPRVAFLSYSTFGNPEGKWLDNIRGAITLLDQRGAGFEYEGEMPPDVALNPELMKNYPFMRLSEPANVLIMPGLQSANLSAKILRELGGDRTIGPMLLGIEKPVQIATMSSTASELVTLAVLAAAGTVE